MKALATGVAVLVAIALAGCGEKPQASAVKKADAQAYQGANAAFTEAGWKVGDAASWQQQIRNRGLAQDENVRSGAK